MADIICEAKSAFLRLSKNDFVRGLFMTILGASLGGIYEAVQLGTVISIAVLKNAGIVGVGAGLSYLMKNLVTNSEDKILKPEPKSNP